MGELNQIVSRFDEIETLIIKITEVVGLILVCLLILKGHYEKLRRRHKKRGRAIQEKE